MGTGSSPAPSIRNQPSGFPGVDECFELAAPRPGNRGQTVPDGETDAFGIAEPGEVELQRARRDLGRSGIHVVGPVEAVLDGFVVVVPPLIENPAPGPFRALQILHGPEVPQIGPVEGEPDPAVLAPDERAEHPVPERQSFVP